LSQGRATPRLSLVRMTARPIGLILLVLAAQMLLCAWLGYLALPEDGWDSLATAAGADHMLTSAGVTGAAAVAFLVASLGVPFRIGRRESLFVVSTVWLGMGVFGAVPFVISSQMSVPDAIFEAVSGVTTTGGTVLTDIEGSLSAPLHLWRVATQWIGGLGIVVLFVALFPALGVGGKRLFQSEAAGPQADGLTPRIRDTAKTLWWVYLGLTLTEMVILRVCGLPWFDALAHSLSTLGTGGFSTKNASIAAYDMVSVEVVITVFMLLAGTNFALLHAARRGGWRVFTQNPEFRLYVLLFVGVTIVITMDLFTREAVSIDTAVRQASFQVAAVMTTTGFGTADFEQWSTLSRLLLVGLFYCGGCAGSTAGGMKLIRMLIIGKAVLHEIRLGFRPSLVSPVRIGDQVVPDGVVRATLAYALIFVGTVGLGALALSALDTIDITTAWSASLACVANVGPGLGLVGPTDNYGMFSDGSKLVLSACMLLGRLEFFSLMALFVPGFWRR
jgi:trk system potassium uptake protein TrkH